MKIRMEYIAFWILIALAIALILWKLVGSPTDTATLITIALFIVGSEILIWKSIFKIDKKTSLGFMKMRNHMDNKFDSVDNKFNQVNSRLDNIENLLRRKR